MFNLMKSIARSFKKNLMLLFFFSFLLIGSALTFGSLYGTANSMKTAYNNVATKGNIHDFTIKNKLILKDKVKYKYDLRKNSRGKNLSLYVFNKDYSGLSTLQLPFDFQNNLKSNNKAGNTTNFTVDLSFVKKRMITKKSELEDLIKSKGDWSERNFLYFVKSYVLNEIKIGPKNSGEGFTKFATSVVEVNSSNDIIQNNFKKIDISKVLPKYRKKKSGEQIGGFPSYEMDKWNNLVEAKNGTYVLIDQQGKITDKGASGRRFYLKLTTDEKTKTSNKNKIKTKYISFEDLRNSFSNLFVKDNEAKNISDENKLFSKAWIAKLVPNFNSIQRSEIKKIYKSKYKELESQYKNKTKNMDIKDLMELSPVAAIFKSVASVKSDPDGNVTDYKSFKYYKSNQAIANNFVLVTPKTWWMMRHTDPKHPKLDVQSFDFKSNIRNIAHNLSTRFLNLINKDNHLTKEFNKKVLKETGINLEHNYKESFISNTLSGNKYFKVVKYDPTTLNDKIYNFSKTDKQLFSTLTPMEAKIKKEILKGSPIDYANFIIAKETKEILKQAIIKKYSKETTDKLINNAKQKLITKLNNWKGKFNPWVYKESKSPGKTQKLKIMGLDKLIYPLLKNTVVDVDLSISDFGIKINYKEKIAGDSAALKILNLDWINTDAFSKLDVNAEIGFLRSYVAIGNEQALFSQNKRPVSTQELLYMYDSWRSRANGINWLASIESFIDSGVLDKSHIVEVNGNKFILINSGITADLSYPMLDSRHPIPDFKKEMILYIPQAGMHRIKSTNVSLTTINYIAGNFTSKNKSVQNKQLQKINAIAKEFMNIASDDNVAKMATDTSGDALLVQYRVAYTTELLKAINMISIIAMIVIGALSLMISISIISKFISDRTVSFGILKANGMDSNKIAIAISTYVFIATLILTIGGFTAGIFLQNSVFWMIGKFWTLPVEPIYFNPLGMSIAILVLCVGSTILSYIISRFKLRPSALQLIRNIKISSQNKLFKFIKKFFIFTTIKVKYGVSLLLTSSGRLVGFMMSIIVSTIVINFSISSSGIFQQVKKDTLDKYNYKYKVNLTSPTAAGGLYNVGTWDEISNSMKYRGAQQTFGNNKYEKMIPSWDGHSYYKGKEKDANGKEIFKNRSSDSKGQPIMSWKLAELDKRQSEFIKYNNVYNSSIVYNDYLQATKGTNRSIYGPDSAMYNIVSDGITMPFKSFFPDYKGLKPGPDQWKRWEGKTNPFLSYYLMDNRKVTVNSKNGIMHSWYYYPERYKKAVSFLMKSDDFNNYMRFISTLKDIPENKFRYLLPSSDDEYNANIDVNFLHNSVITKEFMEGNMGGQGSKTFAISISKNLWKWISSAMPSSVVNSALSTEKTFALEVFNYHLKELYDEYNNPGQVVMRMGTPGVELTPYKNGVSDSEYDRINKYGITNVEKLLGHKALREHSFIKWKAFKDVNGNLSVESGLPAVKYDAIAAYNQLPEQDLNNSLNPKQILWNGGFVKTFKKNSDPYFGSPVNVDSGFIPPYWQDKARSIYKSNEKNMRTNAYGWKNIFLQNIYQHQMSPRDKFTYRMPIGVSLKETYFDYIKSAVTNKTFNNTTYKWETNNDKKIANNQFRILFGGVPVENTDSTYTYMTSRLKTVNDNSRPYSVIGSLLSDDLNIMGIDQNINKFINLQNSKNKNIYNKLLSSADSDNVHPIIVNEVFANSLKIKTGDVIGFDIKNGINRMNSKKKKISQKFKIVGILSTYKGPELFTTKAIANKIIGLDKLSGTSKQRFNGILTNDDNSRLLKYGISLYSRSGLYSTSSKFLSRDLSGKKVISNQFIKYLNVKNEKGYKWNIFRTKQNIRTILKSLYPWEDENKIESKVKIYMPTIATPLDSDTYRYSSNQLALAKMLDSKYGKDSILPSVNNAESSKISSSIFSAYTHTAGSFEMVIIVFALIVVSVIILTITSMLITSNIKSFATLKVIGYRKRDISKVFLIIYSPFLAAGILIGTIIAYFIIYLFAFLTLYSIQIYIPIHLTWQSALASITIIGVIFSFAFLSALLSINRIDPLKVLK